MSCAWINHHHKGAASNVSIGLPHEQELTHIFSKYLDVTTIISNESMYQICDRKAV